MVLAISDNLKKRIISSILVLPIPVLIIWLGGLVFNILMLVAAVLMAFEWCNMTYTRGDSYDQKQNNKWTIIGIVYIVGSIISLMYLRNLRQGFPIVMFLFMTVWATDIAAYFVGKTFGGPKILPAISPKKTWSGLFGGMFAAALVNVFVGVVMGSPFLMMIIFGAFLAIVSQVGDFLESWIKRKFDVKDSGTLLPGHGGILDRVDGITTTAPFIAFIAIINGGTVPLW